MRFGKYTESLYIQSMPRLNKKAVNLNPGRKSTGKRVRFDENGSSDKAARVGSWSLNRKERNSHVYDHADWKSLRLHVLQQEPLCPVCKACHRVEPATEVDHIVPVRMSEDNAWDLDNLWPLCHAHHSRKTAYENNLKAIPTEPDRNWWTNKLRDTQ